MLLDSVIIIILIEQYREVVDIGNIGKLRIRDKNQLAHIEICVEGD